jgi:YgiT-type zinc finger domain-containing protein
VSVTLWFGAELKLVEGVPADVCPNCHARYYDKAVERKLDSLMAAGFPDWKIARVVAVPVFSYADIVDFERGELRPPSAEQPHPQSVTTRSAVADPAGSARPETETSPER